MQSRFAMFSQVLQAWKAQPVFISFIGCSSAADVTSAMARCNAPAASALMPLANGHSRLYNNGSSGSVDAATGNRGGGGPADGSADSSLWSSLRRSLFPIGPSKLGSPSSAIASPGMSSPPAAASPSASAASSTRLRSSGQSVPTAAALTAGRNARAAERRAARAKEDAFTALSKNAERFSGSLLKAAVLLITVPLGIHMLSHSLMMSLCIRGLEADRRETVVLTLRRIRSVVVSEYLARKFEEEDGVGLMMNTFSEGSGDAVLREFVATAQQLMQYRTTRDALLMSSLVARLERALAAGWLPEGDLREAARQLYLDAHAALRMEMEVGASTAPSSPPSLGH
ncbi:hypothetical protein VaNZ11_016769 [Volvox africanus]|uniref:Uncharacterized protein n=1 Tax=Volvox africanus TaxID=51714 RepID=A0ABQ5SNF4_9CHLO|nr:hypothetical protein VaNZ11_016769 [Volvox africanus]